MKKVCSRESQNRKSSVWWVRMIGMVRFRLFVRAMFCGVVAVVVVAGACGQVQEQVVGDRPNVLMILTDDQGWGDVGVNGNRVIETPNIDRIASEGARFERFFVSPVCAPTRASLLTGRYHLRTGTHGVTRGRETMRAEERTLGEAFKDNGYATGCFGKWHNGAHFPQDPNGQGFEEFLGFCAGHWNNYFDTTLQHNQGWKKTEGYMIDVLTDAAIEFMERNHEAGKQFFCYVPFNSPHSPWQVPDSFFAKYKAMGLDDTTACAYAMCENIDWNVGRLLDALDRMESATDTVVMFMGDNGPNSDRYNGGMKGRKGSVNEGGVRVPLFVRYPRWIKPGVSVPVPTMHIDLFPTMKYLCTMDMGESAGRIDGKPLISFLYGLPGRWSDRSLFTFRGDNPGRGAVRNMRWRAVREGRGREWELYDMLLDPMQSRSVAEENPEVLGRMSGEFDAKFEDVSKQGFDPIPTEIGHPEAPVVVLPGHEALLRPGVGKGIRYSGRAGWANDWVTGWTNPASFPEWPVKVVRSGDYAVSLDYACGDENTGCRLVVEVGEAVIEFQVNEAYESETIAGPDRVPRKEVSERTWKTLDAGTLALTEGAAAMLRVRVLDMPGPGAINLKAVRLRSL